MQLGHRLGGDHIGEFRNGRLDEVVEVGEFSCSNVAAEARSTYHDRKRPIEPGYSVGGLNSGAGTIGCFLVIDKAGHLLSNLHVLQGLPFAPIYQPVLQPGPADRGTSPNDIVGDATLYVPLNSSGSNTIDAATSKLRDISTVNPNAFVFGPLKGYYNQVVISKGITLVGDPAHPENVVLDGSAGSVTNGQVRIYTPTGAVSVLLPAKTYWPSYWVFRSEAIDCSMSCAELITDSADVELPVEAALSCERS